MNITLACKSAVWQFLRETNVPVSKFSDGNSSVEKYFFSEFIHCCQFKFHLLLRYDNNAPSQEMAEEAGKNEQIESENIDFETWKYFE